MTVLDDFDAITVEQLRAIGGMKWSRFDGDVIGAFVAAMDFGTAPEITAALHEAVDGGVFGYLPAALATAMSEACARWQRDVYGWDIAPERIRPMADVIACLQATIEQFSTPDSAVIVPTPAYMPFLFVPKLLGREIIEVPMQPGDGGRMQYDLDGIAAAFAQGGEVLIVCNPHNPLGLVHDRDELVAVSDVVAAHGGRVFSDEIHAPLVYAPARHVPYATVSEVAAGHTISATSASKAWNLPGLKCAQLLLSNDADAAKWAEVGLLPEHGASNAGVVANTAAFAHGRPWLDDVLGYLDGNRHLLASLLAEHLPEVVYRPPEGTYLAWLDIAELDLGDQPAQFFHEHAGVALVDGAMCGAPGFVRVNFATPRPILEQLVHRMARAVRAR